jgi:hypothetical protein
MLTDWTSFDKTALAVMLGVSVFFVKYLLELLKDIFTKKQVVADPESHEFIVENRRTMKEAIDSINRQFESYTDRLSKHDTRILHMEKSIESLLNDRCCPAHEETVRMVSEIRSDIKHNATKIDGLVATLDTMSKMGAIHSHPK